jgi:hypothetical protein
MRNGALRGGGVARLRPDNSSTTVQRALGRRAAFMALSVSGGADLRDADGAGRARSCLGRDCTCLTAKRTFYRCER